MKKFILWAAVLTAILAATAALAKVYITIDQPGKTAFPLAFPDLMNTGAAADPRGYSAALRAVVEKDLDLTGLFQIISPKAYLAKDKGLNREEIDFPDWSSIGAEGLVKGGYFLKGDTLSVDLRVYDVVRGIQISGKNYLGDLKTLRSMGHMVANQIVQAFTGEEAFFGTRLAYVSSATGHKEIYIMDVDGENMRRVTFDNSIDLTPSWSPDGTRILFTSYIRKAPYMFQYDFLTGRERIISARPGLNIGGVFSPDGKTIACTLSFEGSSEIYLLDRDGGHPRRLTHTYGINVSPAWSPDGSRIAFVSDREGSPQVFIMDKDGSGVRRITYSGNYNVDPAWSPVGDRIAYASLQGNDFNVFTVSPDGSDVVQLTQGPGSNEDPAWAPHGHYLVFSSTRDGHPELYLMSANGSFVRRLTSTHSGAMSPAWSPPVNLVIKE